MTKLSITTKPNHIYNPCPGCGLVHGERGLEEADLEWWSQARAHDSNRKLLFDFTAM